MLPQTRLRFLLAEGPGAGKTIMAGLLIRELKVRQPIERVLLLVPKTPREEVWERRLRARLPHVGGFGGGDYSNLAVHNHTDLKRVGDWRAGYTATAPDWPRTG